MNKRVLVIGLDGFEISIARTMIKDGKLPYMAEMFASSAFFNLDHGDARNTGLAWEHFSTGQEPDSYKKWSAIDFDADTYSVNQSGFRGVPFTADLPVYLVAFDVPYLELADSQIVGMSNWGAHDPGVQRNSNPPELLDEIEVRFGPYPAPQQIYGFVWPSVGKTQRMASELTAAAKKRSDIIEWLFSERYPDWELGIAVTSELHSGIEALWHGWDENHPLHSVASAEAARIGIEDLYIETDRMLANLAAKFPDATLIAFSMHGMGANNADVHSMILLPEFMYRRTFGTPFLHPKEEWVRSNGCEMDDNSDWTQAILPRMGHRSPDSLREQFRGKMRRLGLNLKTTSLAEPVRFNPAESLSWMPSVHYKRFWPEMSAFAMPSFYEGQIRVNLQGREAEGIIALEDYAAFLDQLEQDLFRLTDFQTGESVVEKVERPLSEDPLSADSSQCDLRISWKTLSAGFQHPEFGAIGPVPHRRPGGHTGEFGFATVMNSPLATGDHGTRSSFDVVPTIFELCGYEFGKGTISGRSLLKD